VPILIVIANNYYYQTVRSAFANYNGRMKATGNYHGLYLGEPNIDFVKLAESQSVHGERITAPGDIQAALKRGVQATKDGRSYVVELIVARVGIGAESTWHQKFDLGGTRTRRV